jgi:malic enzyme
MKVTVHVRPDAKLNSSNDQQATAQAKEIAETAKQLGVVLEPMHPSIDDPRLANSFAVEVPDAAAAERVIDRLQTLEAIEAAYLKPSDELP